MSHMQTIPTDVLAAFDAIPPANRDTLLTVRELILEVAQQNPRIGQLEEALRWGEPAYITTRNKTGSTIRLGIEKRTGSPALFFNCKTPLVEEFRQTYGTAMNYSKNRAILLDTDVDQLSDMLTSCIAASLTYHLRC